MAVLVPSRNFRSRQAGSTRSSWAAEEPKGQGIKAVSVVSLEATVLCTQSRLLVVEEATGTTLAACLVALVVGRVVRPLGLVVRVRPIRATVAELPQAVPTSLPAVVEVRRQSAVMLPLPETVVRVAQAYLRRLPGRRSVVPEVAAAEC